MVQYSSGKGSETVRTNPTCPDSDRVWELLTAQPTLMVQGQTLCRERLQVAIRR